MKCLICHGEEVRVTQVNEAFPLGNDIVYLGIQTLVCQTCGERYYDRKTIRFLEDFEAKLREGKVQLQQVGKILTGD